VRYFQGDTDDDGKVVLATVTLQAQSAGSTDINIVQNSEYGTLLVGDESGEGYTLENIGSATLTVTGDNQPPTANVGADQTVDEGATVTLDASGSSDSDGSIASYSWSQTGNGPSVTLSDTSAAQPTFTAPDVSSDQTLTFEVEVTDDDGATTTDTVSVTVTDTDTGDDPGDGTPDAGETSVELVGTDSDGTIGIAGSNTYDVVVTNADGGVGAFALTVSSSDASTATVTDATIVPDPVSGETTTEVEVTDSSATLEAALLDTADSGSVTIGTVTLTGAGAGTASVDLSVNALGNEAGDSYEVITTPGASLEVISLEQVDPSYEGLPTDIDNDGYYEDINGDGELTVADVQGLWAHRNADTITNYGEHYDFNEDGTFDVVDVQALWNELNSQQSN
jgi:hypothetical protein